MKIFKISVWILVGIFFLISFLAVTGIFFPSEKISAVWLLTAAGCFYALAYRFYGAFLSARVLSLEDSKSTPALRFNDGKNYYPTNKWVLFGHHFAAIAGAGPLIGPVLASQFGFLPGFIWILIGSVVAGGVHDLVILVSSVRRDGKSLAKIAEEEVSRVTGYSALIAILFVLVIAIAGLGLAFINSLIHNPWGTFIIGMTIPIALFMGIYMKSVRPERVLEISLMGGFALILTIIFGREIAGTKFASYLDLGKNTLTAFLMIYGFVAASLPVWLLLAPRDYLSSFMKIGVILMLAAGVLVVAPDLNMPRVTYFIDGGGPIVAGKIFPYLFIT
ncbi:MAG: carbon starvation protein A, partial [Oligoflexales bacterium]|nr:carbon starvation protein A [Oligoflexales bacterium]